MATVNEVVGLTVVGLIDMGEIVDGEMVLGEIDIGDAVVGETVGMAPRHANLTVSTMATLMASDVTAAPAWPDVCASVYTPSDWRFAGLRSLTRVVVIVVPALTVNATLVPRLGANKKRATTALMPSSSAAALDVALCPAAVDCRCEPNTAVGRSLLSAQPGVSG